MITVKLSPISDKGDPEYFNQWNQVGVTDATKYDAIDDDPDLAHDEDSTYIWHNTINKLQMFYHEDGNIPEEAKIESVVLHFIARDTGTGNNRFKLYIEFAPETPLLYHPEKGVALTTSYQEYTFDVKDDEEGKSRIWIPSDFDGQQIEIGGRATGAGGKERRITQMWLEVKYSVELPPPAVEETQRMEVLRQGQENSFAFEKSELAITDITVVPKITINNVAITVKALETNPNDTELAKKVFKYLRISKENLEDSEIDAVKINFKVPKVWVIENKLCDEPVFLYKSINDKWVKCNMSTIKKDKEFYYYEAQTTTLSDFGMGGNPGC